MKYICIDKINCREPFSSVFPLNENKINQLLISMEKRGFDDARAIDVIQEDENSYTLIRGNSRYLAAKKLGIKSLPANVHTFTSDKSNHKLDRDKLALKYVLDSEFEEAIKRH